MVVFPPFQSIDCSINLHLYSAKSHLNVLWIIKEKKSQQSPPKQVGNKWMFLYHILEPPGSLLSRGERDRDATCRCPTPGLHSRIDSSVCFVWPWPPDGPWSSSARLRFPVCWTLSAADRPPSVRSICVISVDKWDKWCLLFLKDTLCVLVCACVLMALWFLSWTSRWEKCHEESIQYLCVKVAPLTHLKVSVEMFRLFVFGAFQCAACMFSRFSGSSRSPTTCKRCQLGTSNCLLAPAPREHECRRSCDIKWRTNFASSGMWQSLGL